jgi:hypothetical protein
MVLEGIKVYRRIIRTMIILVMAISVPLLHTSSLEAARIGDALILCFSFDEGSGNVVEDSSLRRFNGTVNGGAEWAQGKFGGALHFDGVDDFVSVPDSSELRLLNGGTFMAWINYEGSGASAWPRVLSKEKGTGGEGGYHIFLDQAGGYSPRVTVGGRGHTSDEDLEAGIWYHVAATCDGTNIRIYLNGKKILEEPQESPFIDANPELRIGDSAAAQRPFFGLIDEVRVWGRVLNTQEIEQQMNMSGEELKEFISVDPLLKSVATWGGIKL